MSNLNLRLLPLARKDLRDVARHTRQEWGKEQQREIKLRFNKVFEELSRYPKLGRARTDLGQDVRTFAFGRRVIVYRLDDFGLTILRIVHERQMLTEELLSE